MEEDVCSGSLGHARNVPGTRAPLAIPDAFVADDYCVELGPTRDGMLHHGQVEFGSSRKEG